MRLDLGLGITSIPVLGTANAAQFGSGPAPPGYFWAFVGKNGVRVTAAKGSNPAEPVVAMVANGNAQMVDITTLLASERMWMKEAAGTYTFNVPSDLVGNKIKVSGTAAGGGGGDSCGGGGVAGQPCDEYELVCSPGDVLTVTLGAQGTGGVPSGAAPTAGGDISITGATTPNGNASVFPGLLGGSAGGRGSGSGGTGGNGRGVGGLGGGAVGAPGSSVTVFGRIMGTPGGGGGANDAGGTAGAGGSVPEWPQAAGGGVNGGGGGGGGHWGAGQQGSASGVDANQNPVWKGHGGGGAGGGHAAKGGPGGPPMIKFKYVSITATTSP